MVTYTYTTSGLNDIELTRLKKENEELKRNAELLLLAFNELKRWSPKWAYNNANASFSDKTKNL